MNKTIMQKISPCLWFDSQAEEAANFYISIFKNSRIMDVAHYGEAASKASGRPKGSVLTVTFELEGQGFMGLNGGPVFKFSPAISFFVNCETEQEIEELWKKFSQGGGRVLMQLDKYPFSKKFGWLEDRFGVSWQFNLASHTQKITPFLTYVGEQHGKAQEAIDFYSSLFKDSRIINIERNLTGEEEPEGTIKHARFSLNGQEFMAMESSSKEHRFTFTSAISFLVNCETQEEVDELWDRLSQGGEIMQCGWLKDKFGVAWQIVPKALGQMMLDKDVKRSERVMEAMLQMKKIDIEGLKRAYAS